MSINTVSLALRDSSLVAKATAEKIRQIAEELRYRPNTLIRAIQTGRSDTVGVLVQPAHEWTARLLIGIQQGLQTEGLLPMLDWLPSYPFRPSQPDERSELDVIHNLIDHRVDGIIVYPSDEKVTDLYFKEVWERGIPLVTIDRLAEKTHADFVGTDETAGGRAAAEHLLSLGHRRIAHIAGYQGYGTYAKRRKVFEKTIKEAGAECITFEAGQFDDGSAAVGQLFALTELPTAVFAAADWFARPIYKKAAELGLSIPADLSVVGYGGLEWNTPFDPPLTTIRQDPEQMGREAAGLILQRLYEKTAPPDRTTRQVRVLPELVVGNSTTATGDVIRNWQSAC